MKDAIIEALRIILEREPAETLAGNLKSFLDEVTIIENSIEWGDYSPKFVQGVLQCATEAGNLIDPGILLGTLRNPNFWIFVWHAESSSPYQIGYDWAVEHHA